MSLRPILVYALSASRVLRTRTCTYTHNVPINSNNNCRSRSITTTHIGVRFLPSSYFPSSSTYASGGISAGESSCNPSHTISSSPWLWQSVTSRSFASRRRSPKGNNKKSSNVLANEGLVAQLVRNAGEASADKVTVRLVTDEGADTPSSVQVITLSEAIELSLDRELDLIGANISGDPPVIRATQLSKLEYKQQQAQKKQKQQSASNKKEKKSFRFKAGIDSADLERKLGRLKDFLSKGHDCDFTVFSRLRTLRQNPDAGGELVEQIRTLIADVGDMKRPPQISETKSFYRVQYEAKK